MTEARGTRPPSTPAGKHSPHSRARRGLDRRRNELRDEKIAHPFAVNAKAAQGRAAPHGQASLADFLKPFAALRPLPGTPHRGYPTSSGDRLRKSIRR